MPPIGTVRTSEKRMETLRHISRLLRVDIRPGGLNLCAALSEYAGKRQDRFLDRFEPASNGDIGGPRALERNSPYSVGCPRSDRTLFMAYFGLPRPAPIRHPCRIGQRTVRPGVEENDRKEGPPDRLATTGRTEASCIPAAWNRPSFFGIQSPVIGACQGEQQRCMFMQPHFELTHDSSISSRFTVSVRQNTTIRVARQPSPVIFLIGPDPVRRRHAGSVRGVNSDDRIVRRRLGARRGGSCFVHRSLSDSGSPVSVTYVLHAREGGSTRSRFCYNRHRISGDSSSPDRVER